MNQKKKVIVIAIAVMLLCLVPLAAQTSNTNTATAGIFGTDVDNFMSVNDYSNVEMEKAFGYIGYNGNLQLGYALKLGGLYLGSYYNGNAFYTTDNPTETKNIATANQVTNGVITGETVTTTDSKTNPTTFTDNQINVLLGVAGMGIKLGFYEDLDTAESRFDPTSVDVDGYHTFTDATDSVATNSSTMTKTVTKYTKGSKTAGNMIPSLSWGMKLPVGGMTIKPKVSAYVNLYQDKAFSVRNMYTEVYGEKLDGSSKVTAGKDNGMIAPSVTVGAAVDLAKKDAKQTSFAFDYTFYTQLFSNSDNSVKGNADWVETVTNNFTTSDETKTVDKTVMTTEKTYVEHSFSPSISSTTDLSDKVSFGMKFKTDISYSIDTSNYKTVQKTVVDYTSYSQDPADDYVQTTVVTTPGDSYETTTLSVDPRVSAGLTFKAIPGTLSFNTGLTVYVPAFESIITKKTHSGFTSTKVTTVDGLDYETTSTTGVVTTTRNESQDTENDWDAMSGSIRAGLTLNVDKNIAIDAVMSNSGSFTVNATQLSLILTIKK